ncbi:transposase [Sinorhizobium medicae]|nr:transposase [Sinorhizobium medicae]
MAALERKIVGSVRQDEVARRLTAIPGVGPITAAMVRVAVRSRRLSDRKRLRCLDRLDPKVQFQRRQRETRLDLETGEPSAPLTIGRQCNGNPEAIAEWLCDAAVGGRPSAAASV